jgi:hypothetical protein
MFFGGFIFSQFGGKPVQIFFVVFIGANRKVAKLRDFLRLLRIFILLCEEQLANPKFLCTQIFLSKVGR